MNPDPHTPLASSNEPVLVESIQELADAMPHLVWIANKNGQVIYYNQQVYAYAGIHKDENGHWRWTGMIHPEDVEGTVTAWQKALETGETYSAEHRVQMVNGDYRWHLSRAHLRKSSGGTEDKWFGTATDIHEQKTAEKSLKNAYAQLQTLYSSGQIQIGYFKAVRDAVGNIEDFELLNANPASEDAFPNITNLKEKARISKLFPGLKEQEEWRRAVQVVETGQPQRFEAHSNYGLQPAWYDNYYTPYGDGFIAQGLNIDERKKAEVAIQKAHETTEQQKRLYETVTDNTPDLIYVFDLRYRFTYANKALLQMWGKTWDEAIGKGLLENGYEPWHAEMHHREIDQVIATKQPIRGTVSFPHATLGKRIYDYIFSPVFNEAGEVEAIAGTTRDISDLYHAEREMSHLKNQLELTFNAVPSAISLFDASGKILLANEPAAHLFGYESAAEMRAMDNIKDFSQKVFSRMDFYDPSGQPILPRNMPVYSVLHGGLGARSIIRAVRKKDSDTKWVMATSSPLYGEDDKLSMVLSTYTDITDQKTAEAAIRESESQFRTLAETLPQMIWMKNTEGTMDYKSPRFMEYFGKEPYEGWDTMTQPEDRILAEVAFAKAVETESSFRAEVRLRNKEGQYRWHQSIADPVRDTDGKVVKWIGALIDIHDQKALAETLEKLIAERTAELLRSNTDLQQFAHVASHDLKEPIRKIKTFAGMLEKKLSRETAPEASLYLDKINSAAARTTEMVDGVLSYSSINGGERPVQEIDLRETIRQIETDVEVAIEKRSATISCTALPSIEGAPVLIYQLFYNLINNSLKFAQPNQPLRITLSAQDALVGENPAVLLRVTDNGIGFEQQYAGRIFDSFSRLNAKDKYEGTGLGLALCKKIVERHGGTITAQSCLGEGATFLITLPLRQQKKRI